FGCLRGCFGGGRRWGEAALATAPATEASGGEVPRLRAAALLSVGGLTRYLGDYAAARALYTESLRLFRALGDRRGTARTLTTTGVLACAQGDFAVARSLQEEVLAIMHELGDHAGTASALLNLGIAAFGQGDYAAARGHRGEPGDLSGAGRPVRHRRRAAQPWTPGTVGGRLRRGACPLRGKPGHPARARRPGRRGAGARQPR